MDKRLLVLFIAFSILVNISYLCIGKTEFYSENNNSKLNFLLEEIDSLNHKFLSVDKVIGDRNVNYWEHVINDVYIKNDSVLLHIDTEYKNVLNYKKTWTEIEIEEFDFSEIEINNFFWKKKVVFPEEDDCNNFYSFYEKQDYPIACWEVRHKDGKTLLYDLDGNEIGNGIPAPSKSFLMTGPHNGKDVWDYLRNNAESYYRKWSNSTVSIFNPNRRTELSANVSNPNVKLFFEIAHGSHRVFTASTSGRYYSHHSSNPNVREDMKDRPPIKFAFIGSCGGMDKTGEGSFSYEFRKGQMENTVTVGYTGMANDDGWPKAKPWQDTMFSYIDDHYTIKEAFDLASAEYPKIADAVKFAGDENLKIGNLPPYKAECSYPKDNATGIKPNPNLIVDLLDPADPDGDIVDVSFYDASDDSLIRTDSNVQNGATASIIWSRANKKGSFYQWYAVTDDGVNTNRSETWRFKIDLPPDVPDNPHPFDNERYVNTSPILSVDVSDPDGDNMSVTFYDAYDNSKIGMVENVQSGDTASVTWEDIDYGTTYNWYAVADDGIFDNRSETFSFTTNFLPVFSNLNPVDDKDDVSFYLDKLSVDISDPDGDTFDWSITTSPDIGNNNVKNDFDSSKICVVNTLLPDTSYNWTVTAVDEKGASIESIFNFKTKKNSAPDKPVALSPDDNTQDVSIICNLSWSCIDPDGDKNLVYDVYLGKNSDPPLIKQGLIENYYKVIYDLEIGTTYYWKVVATDRFGASSENSVFSFTTSNTPPPPRPGDIDIDFSKKLCYTGVKADIVNIGVRDVSNVFWEVSVTGGVFNKVNMSKSGCINRLNLSETQLISTKEFFDFKTTSFGLGKAKVSLILKNENGNIVGMKSVNIFLFLRWIFVI